jgi:hypothetical protein
MALVRALTEDAGVRISALHAVSASLFEQCNRQFWAGFERSILIVELASVRVDFVSESQSPRFGAIAIVVSCGPIIAELRERLSLGKEESDQGNLRLAPTIVAGIARGGRVS